MSEKNSSQMRYLAGRIYARLELETGELTPANYANCQMMPQNLLKVLRHRISQPQRLSEETQNLLAEFQPEIIKPPQKGEFDLGYYHERGNFRQQSEAGAATSEAKAAAARENGKLGASHGAKGGRPRIETAKPATLYQRERRVAAKKQKGE